MARLLRLATRVDGRGSLTVVEERAGFPIRRVFFIHGADGARRGGHRHRRTRHVLVAVAGSVDVEVRNDAGGRLYTLDSPSAGLLLEPEDWREMTFGPGAVLLVVASTRYSAADCVRGPATWARRSASAGGRGRAR